MTSEHDTIEQTGDDATQNAETGTANTNRRQPFPQGFLDTISTGWAERPESVPAPRTQAPYAAARRAAVSAAFGGKRLVIPAGSLKQRSNDTDYPFRAHSAFAHLTGWAADAEPDSLLVFEPTDSGHDVTLYFRERADRTTSEFYSDATIGEFWIGPRPALASVAADLGIATAHLDDFASGDDDLVVDEDAELTQVVSELRLVKDDYEIAEMRRAVEITANGFDDIIRDLPRAIAHPRGERIVEGVFHQRARSDGNWEGYDTIAASGPHACYLHWTRNDGAVLPGDLILIDAGAEADSLYTADITRTLPVSGTFSDVQRRIYDTVVEAADAAFAAASVGVPFRAVHAAAMDVIARRTRRVGPAAGHRRGGAGRRHRRAAPPLHGARHQPPPRHRRARLRTGPPRDVLRRAHRAGDGVHDRARPVLPDRRSDRARGVPRHRRAHRGRHPDHCRRPGEPLGRHPAHVRRGRGVDRARAGRRVLTEDAPDGYCP